MLRLPTFEVLLPRVCAVCRLPGESLCVACRCRLRQLSAPVCARCGMPYPQPVATCANCPRGVDWARQAVLYDDTAAALIGALKDRRRRDLIASMVETMVACVGPPPVGATLVPVPAGLKRVRARGFDQAQLLAAALARRWRRPLHAAIRRRRDGSPQRGASRPERLRQLSGAFSAAAGVPRHIVLIDDVLTTGATLAECAAAARTAGAHSVGALCFARVDPIGHSPALVSYPDPDTIRAV